MSVSIGSVSQLVSVIRSELTGTLAGAPGKSARGAKGKAAGGRYAERNLAGLIEVRIRQIGPDDPQRGRKAFRVFLEAVLLSHFGEAMLADPKFHQMLDDVQGAMEADPACEALIGEAIANLLASGGKQD
jgi:hypothetical protein